jgi:uncharacterized protein DUF6680
MATRATPLAPTHVNALNSIDSVFHRRRDRKVREAWEKALQHINVATDAANLPPGWIERLNDLKADLYQVMGKAIGYHYSLDYLKRQIYLPRHFTDADLANATIRLTLAKVLTPDGIKIVPGGPPVPTTAPTAPTAPRR